MSSSKFSSWSTTVNVEDPPAETALLSKLASPIAQTIEAEATTTIPSLYSYETEIPSVCEAVFNTPPSFVLPQAVAVAVYDWLDDIV